VAYRTAVGSAAVLTPFRAMAAAVSNVKFRRTSWYWRATSGSARDGDLVRWEMGETSER